MMRLSKKAIIPAGFKANALFCGIKRSGKPDLALFYSEKPAKAACMFTTNSIIAAPIKVNKEHLAKAKSFRAIVTNSGNANCFTGNAGMLDAAATAKEAALVLKVREEQVLLASTGIILRRLPVGKIKKALPELAAGLSKSGISKAAKAILTTDLVTKEASASFKIGARTVNICGVAKGSGMIAPNMATMLAFILTDAFISQGALKSALRESVEGSFNCITIDGCMSTNDSVMLLANGAAGNPLIDSGASFKLFSQALRSVCLELAKMLVRDGEGATKFIKIRVEKAKSVAEARKVALQIANSDLFKTAMYGENPNFGRIAGAVGASRVGVKEKDLKIKVGSLKKKNIDVNVSIGRGSSSAVVYTTDLTNEYIKINAEYN